MKAYESSIAASADIKHIKIIANLVEKMRDFYKKKQSFCVYYNSINTTHSMIFKSDEIVDTSQLTRILKIDTREMTTLIKLNMFMNMLI